MLDDELRQRGITDEQVLAAIQRVPRHEFVPPDLRGKAYANRPLPIGYNQTISQPLIVAEMTALARPQPTAKALDVGTGSGYQAAVLAELVDHVYSVEILEPLAKQAQERLSRLGYRNVTVRCGDGYQGWPEEAPFDIIVVAAAPRHAPQPLVDQLAPGGRLVIPVGPADRQVLQVLERQLDDSVQTTTVVPVAFVPMTGQAERTDREPPRFK